MTDTTIPTDAGSKITDATTTTEAPADASTSLTAADTPPPTDPATALSGEPATPPGEATPKTEDKAKQDDDKTTPPAEYTLEAPEGVTLNADMLKDFSATAKEMGLTQEQAQMLVTRMSPIIQGQALSSVKAAQAEWKDAQVSDKEFGGEKFAANLAIARKGVAAFASPELMSLLNQTGLGDHPEMIRVFYRAGKAISEDTFHGANSGHRPPQPLESTMFPTMNRNS